MQFPDARSESQHIRIRNHMHIFKFVLWGIGMTMLGHEKCHYLDAKKTMIGGVHDAWVFFKFKTVGLE